MSQTSTIKIGQIRELTGCFTEEYFLRGKSLRDIFIELGLPDRRLTKGAFIAFALQLPSYHEFELGGWAQFSTDQFVEYRHGRMKWSEKRYKETYDGKRIPLTIKETKEAWLKQMQFEKLIKVLPMLAHDEDQYPSGGLASQIIITCPISCQVVKFLKPYQVFRGVWD